ncbi:hypothetical protein CDAR_440101 [Caerostris darwini]|uniref:Uncharacterized protein n=1 Tax=Caerostris darwini TaxID=1538125 RepID=A0AAV4RKJ7_9ARAC|nr:hypothetical protein CDAR_440101 [Caerostris darwini]
MSRLRYHPEGMTTAMGIAVRDNKLQRQRRERNELLNAQRTVGDAPNIIPNRALIRMPAVTMSRLRYHDEGTTTAIGIAARDNKLQRQRRERVGILNTCSH